LHQQYAIESARILTETPLSTPVVLTIGRESSNQASWVNMGYPRRIPNHFFSQQTISSTNVLSYGNDFDLIRNIRIVFRSHDLSPFYENITSLDLAGYLVFTGEPHLVIFPMTDFSLPNIGRMIFTSPIDSIENMEAVEKRASFGSWLVHHIGTFINKNYSNLFPDGINVDFVYIDEDHEIINLRCFERGINRETLACGTGALASIYISKKLQLINKDICKIYPFRCHWYEPLAFIQVSETENGWYLNGYSRKLFEGIFDFAINKTSTPSQNQSSTVSERQVQAEVSSALGRNRSQILIVEDDPKQLKLLQAYLQNLNYNLVVANNGQQALEIIQQEKIDLVILDIILPDTNGYKVCQEIKRSEATWNIPVIFTTSLADIDSKITGIKSEGDDFLVKPINPVELKAKIHLLLKKKRHVDQLKYNHEMTASSTVIFGGYRES
jgi:CheY-like chemotaxis protein